LPVRSFWQSLQLLNVRLSRTASALTDREPHELVNHRFGQVEIRRRRLRLRFHRSSGSARVIRGRIARSHRTSVQ